MQKAPILSLFPLTAQVNGRGHLSIGGCDIVELATEFGTPLYIFDETTLRGKCAEFRREFGSRYPDTTVIYACKAFTNLSLIRLLNEEGLGLDVVSGGEIGIAKQARFPLDRVYFHGNNKSAAELRQALEWGIGRVVVDNFHELAMLGEIAEKMKRTVDILLRFSPAVDPHTHKYISTGILDTKFGFPLASLEEAVTRAMSMPRLKLLGLHLHIGSLITEMDPYRQAIDVALRFAAEMKQKHGFELNELNTGGGMAVQYTLDAPVPPVSAYAEAIASEVVSKCKELKLAKPALVVEPGRAIVGQAGVAVYTVGAVKDIPGIRRYVSVDGGMGDNIRPAIYGSRYEAILANRVPSEEEPKPTVTICGRYCESGDILIRDIDLPPISPGDILAVPDCGAYCIPMSSNYNAAFKPALVMVKDGKARIIRRRETLEDLTRCDA
ncbi:MAG: diaminopimelate decarboxylase [Chloroflexi bacterium]|nr:diaminopimelate decarboxylase [Chloroflexota bacterium]